MKLLLVFIIFSTGVSLISLGCFICLYIYIVWKVYGEVNEIWGVV